MRQLRRQGWAWANFVSDCLLLLVVGCGVQVPRPVSNNGTGGGTSGGSSTSPQAAISVTPSNLSFENVAVNMNATQPVAITSTGSATLNITLLTLNGRQFSLSGSPTVPISLAPSATYTLEVKFAPTATGSVSGGLTITSNAANSSSVDVNLSGSGVQPSTQVSYYVQLTWDAPGASTDPIVGYDIYRAVSGTGNFALLNGPVVSTTSYSDMNVPSGNWDYEVRSVDGGGVTSAPSNVFTVAVP